MGRTWCVNAGCLYDFDHLLASQGGFAQFHGERTYSSTMDLSHGYEAYVEGRRRANRKIVLDNGRKIRKLERDVGPIRFVLHENTPEAFEALQRWKSDQYRSSGAYDVFRHRWTIDLLTRLCAIQSDDFAGVFSTLYANDQLIAVHFGIRSRAVWHYWFCIAPGSLDTSLSHAAGLSDIAVCHA